MDQIIAFAVEHAELILTIVIVLGGFGLKLLRDRAKEFAKEVLKGFQILKQGLGEDSPGGKQITEEEARALRTQGKVIIGVALENFLGKWLKKFLGINIDL